MAPVSRDPASHAPVVDPDSRAAHATIYEAIEAVARYAPDRPALRGEGYEVTYRELLVQADQVARGLRSIGVGLRDRVLLYSDNAPEQVVAFLACVHIGATVVWLEPDARGAALAHAVGPSGARVLLGQGQLFHNIHALPRGIHEIEHAYYYDGPAERLSAQPWSSLLDAGLRHDEALRAAPPELPAGVFLTSGSTAEPKLVVHAQRAMLHHARAIAGIAGFRPDDRLLAWPVLAATFGCVHLLLPALLCGASVVMLRARSTACALWHIEHSGVTWVLTYPSSFARLCAAAEQAGAVSHRIRGLLSSGDVMPVKLRSRCRTLFGVEVREGYGLTEACMFTLAPFDASHKPGSVGPAIPGMELRIVNDDGAPLPAGEVGHVVARGASMMLGYDGEPELTAATIRDGWLQTCDLGHLDEDGVLWFKGRVSQVINSRARLITPQAVEQAIVLHPDVAEVAVIGPDDPVDGQRVVACVCPRPGATIDVRALEAVARENLFDAEVPVEWVLCASLPQTRSGKMDRKRVLRAYLAGELDRVPGSPAVRLSGEPDRSPTRTPTRVVVKLGTNSLTHPESQALHLDRVDRIAREIARLRQQDVVVLLVVSGARYFGRAHLHERGIDDALITPSVAAARGQVRLMEHFAAACARHGLEIGQLILSPGDLDDAAPVRAMVDALVSAGLVPIANENTALYPDGLPGRNDVNAARLAVATGAARLILLSDVEGLYDRDPAETPAATLIRVVDEVPDPSDAGELRSSGFLKTGGLRPKLEAAALTMSHGISMVLARPGDESVFTDLLIEEPPRGTLFHAASQAPGTPP